LAPPRCPRHAGGTLSAPTANRSGARPWRTPSCQQSLV
jgi:hypothetical protein